MKQLLPLLAFLTVILTPLKAQDIYPISYSIAKDNQVLKNNRNATLEFDFCDQDGDGFMLFNLSEIEELILQFQGFETGEEILISTASGRIISVLNPSNNPSIEFICYPGLTGGGFTDVAVNEELDVYHCSPSNIFELNIDNCIQTPILNFPFGTGVNSLSFDTLGNLYYGLSSESNVYRYEIGGSQSPYIWHTFTSGNAGGDFVMLNGKMYISWKIDSFDYRLYEVTVDNNLNYISHVDLGQIPDKTYGLASELGQLYGVTEQELYLINLDDFTFNTVITNNDSFGAWYGAAGLHEAINLVTSSYLSFDDAENNTNPLEENWTNTIYTGQTIYIKIENTINSEYEIHEVVLNITITPQITTPSSLINCSETPTSNFNLTNVESQLLINVTQPVTVSYFINEANAINNINTITTDYQSINANQTIFIRVQNTTDDCFAISQFNIVTNVQPKVKEITNLMEDRLLSNCYINKYGQGYFLLDEIVDSLILIGNSSTYQVEFYSSFQDATDGVNQISNNYYYDTTETELFVKVLGVDNCHAITNFFLEENCILTTSNLNDIYFPKFITPNQDGFNDYWNIKGISEKVKKESIINIYNRYGKLLKSFIPYTINGWDGTYNGTLLPTDDYWYTFQTQSGKEFIGHFSLIH